MMAERGLARRKAVPAVPALAGFRVFVDHPVVNMLSPVLLLAAAAIAEATPRTYLVSLVDFPLRTGDSIESFSIATWGVEFRAVCKIPSGWRLKVGNSVTPDGMLEGEASHGETWLDRRTFYKLEAIVLVELTNDVERGDAPRGPEATFWGYVTISGRDGQRREPLTDANVVLNPSWRCL
jgi:hypothetical protein